MRRCKTYVAAKIVDAVVLLVIFALLILFGSVVREAYFADAGAHSDLAPTAPTQAERLARVEHKLDQYLTQEGLTP